MIEHEKRFRGSFLRYCSSPRRKPQVRCRDRVSARSGSLAVAVAETLNLPDAVA